MSKTLKYLRDAIRTQCDLSGSDTYISDNNLNNMINLSVDTLRDTLMDNFGSDLFVQTASYGISVTANTDTYDFSGANAQKIMAVDLKIGNYYYDVPPASWGDRNAGQLVNIYPEYRLHGSDSGYKYLLLQEKIKLVPTPQESMTLGLWFIPQIDDMSSDTSTTPDTIEDQWLRWVIYDVSIDLRMSTEEDIQGLSMKKSQIENKIEKAANNRIAAQVRKAPDVSNKYNSYQFYRRY
jgi:hypothetical protein